MDKVISLNPNRSEQAVNTFLQKELIHVERVHVLLAN
jgi:hypothetical protein